MREIKFRAWIGNKMLSPDRTEANIALRGIKQTDDFILMQYTGRKDKNGVEIYEGDICRDDQGYLSEVMFGKLPLNKSGDCVCTYEAF